MAACMEVEKAIAVLRKASGSGQSLHEHLSRVLLKLIEEKPEDCFESFETISAQVKGDYLWTDALPEYPEVAIAEDDSRREAVAKQAELIRALFNKKLPPPPKSIDPDAEEADGADDDDAEADEPQDDAAASPNCAIDDVVAHGAMFRNAGVQHLDEETTFKIMLAMRKLAHRVANLKTARFFGIVRGIHADYYVAETSLEEYPEVPEDADPKDRCEAPGHGINEFVYYATTKLIDCEWAMLPDVTPRQVKLARSMRRMFTGHLDAPVCGSPKFPWKEDSYLRAVIARIASATVLAPSSYYQVSEEEEEESDQPSIVVNEEFEVPTGGANGDDGDAAGGGGAAYSSPSSWCHHRRHLRREGRVAKWEPPEEEEDAEDDEDGGDGDTKNDDKDDEDEGDADEEVVDVLRSLVDDEARTGATPCWSFRVSPEHRTASDDNSIGLARSTVWPGAVSAAKKSGNTLAFASIYIGSGMKHLGTPYTPPMLPRVTAEFQEMIPNPTLDEEEPEDEEAEDGAAKVQTEKPPAVVSMFVEETDPTEPPKVENEENADEEPGEDFDE